MIDLTWNRSNDARSLRLDLDAACGWEGDWLVRFRPDGCGLVGVARGRGPVRFACGLRGRPLAGVGHSGYLGIALRGGLGWNRRVDSIADGADRSLGFLGGSLRVRSSAVGSRACRAFVGPGLECASAVWDPRAGTRVGQIGRVRRRAARYVTNRYHNTSSVTGVLRGLGWPSLEVGRTRVRLMVFCGVIRHVVAIHPLGALLLPTAAVAGCGGGRTCQHVRTDGDSYGCSFCPGTVVRWNILPIRVHEAVTVDAFEALVPVAVLAPIYHV